MSDRVWRPAAYPLISLTRKIIGGFYSTYHDIRYGFLERVYQRGLTVELRHMGLEVQEEVRFEIYHRGVCIGVYRADHVVEGQVVLEIKTGPLLDPMPQSSERVEAAVGTGSLLRAEASGKEGGTNRSERSGRRGAPRGR